VAKGFDPAFFDSDPIKSRPVSWLGRQFVQSLLTKTVERRPSAQMSLKHSWCVAPLRGC
jgi:hypothetical protein